MTRTRRALERCVKIVSGRGTPEENISGTSSPNKDTRCDGTGFELAAVRDCGWWWWAVRAHACGWLPSALQSRRCVYPVGVTGGGLPLRVMSEVAPITLGRDEFKSDLSQYYGRCSPFLFGQFQARTSRGSLHSQEWVTDLSPGAYRHSRPG